MTILSKNLGGYGLFGLPATPMVADMITIRGSHESGVTESNPAGYCTFCYPDPELETKVCEKLASSEISDLQNG